MEKVLTLPVFADAFQNEDASLWSDLLAVFEFLPCVTWIVDRDCKRFSFLTKNISTYSGYCWQDYLHNGLSMHEATIHAEDINRVSDGVQHFYSEIDKILEGRSMSCFRISDYRVISYSGGCVHVREHSWIFRQDANGYPREVISCLFFESESNFGDLNTRLVDLVHQHKSRKTTSQPEGKGKVKFTARETEILKLICQGKTSRDISEQLYISCHTVNTHRQKMIEKTNVNNIGAVISYALRHHII
ncbi:helix-turn-helix transcriptional regulator [Dyadobacter sp. BHUBP1]|uniref:helix-turn-helix transcriptional regulator n=1 Tax=Dyadobacter sp. BHUBP1 TaxID=3424178 RepID=UPI003D340239